MPTNTTEASLKEITQLTGASWSAWLESGEDWSLRACYHLTNKQRLNLFKYLAAPALRNWLSAGLRGETGPRTRVVSTRSGLPAGRLYAFADPGNQRVLLVSALALSPAEQRIWRVISRADFTNSLLDPSLTAVSLNPDLEIPFHLPEALNRLLATAAATGQLAGGAHWRLFGDQGQSGM